ncbi:MAG TPA: substrate-binding domain-containing protein [Terriglobales bacterium]
MGSSDNGIIRAVLSLTIDDGAYQSEQARVAQHEAQGLNVDLQIIYAGNDPLTQSEQLLRIIQGPKDARPDLIMLEPVGTALPHVAKAAVKAGIGWVLLNRVADYLPELRAASPVPVCAVTDDQEEIGRIQGKQMHALLPDGGSLLYVQGPSVEAAQLRTAGMMTTKPENITLRMLRGKWTEQSGYDTTASSLRLRSTSDAHIDGVFAQNDLMAQGARRAFMELAPDRVNSMFFTGVDGLPFAGQAWVRDGRLVATVQKPTTSEIGLRLAVKGLRAGTQPVECTTVTSKSFPDLNALKPLKRFSNA